MIPLPPDPGWCGDPRRGASLGRISTPPGPAHVAVSLRRVRLNSGGYDSGGAYWGHGEPLYWAASECGTVDLWLRARTREAARAAVLEQFPNARVRA